MLEPSPVSWIIKQQQQQQKSAFQILLFFQGCTVAPQATLSLSLLMFTYLLSLFTYEV